MCWACECPKGLHKPVCCRSGPSEGGQAALAKRESAHAAGVRGYLFTPCRTVLAVSRTNASGHYIRNVPVGGSSPSTKGLEPLGVAQLVEQLPERALSALLSFVTQFLFGIPQIPMRLHRTCLLFLQEAADGSPRFWCGEKRLLSHQTLLRGMLFFGTGRMPGGITEPSFAARFVGGPSKANAAQVANEPSHPFCRPALQVISGHSQHRVAHTNIREVSTCRFNKSLPLAKYR